MKKISILSLCFLAFVTIISSCDSDEGLAPIEISLNSIPAITIDENPNDGQVLAMLSGTVNRGELAFSLSNQNPAGAMAIDAQSGELTVADASLFDFEANPTVTATGNITVEGETKSATITVNLNNVPETVTAPDFTFSIAENPNNGDTIGTVVGTTDAGLLTYSFSGKGPVGVSISENGVFTVNTVSIFDYETFTQLSGRYEATNGADTKTGEFVINITDVVAETVQERLDAGETPKEIIDSGVTVDSLYGKDYNGGAIANIDADEVVIMLKTHIGTGNYGASNNAAEGYNGQGYSDWKLPTKAQIDDICGNLRADIIDAFPSILLTDYAWTFTKCGNRCVEVFDFSNNASCETSQTSTLISNFIVPVRVETL